MSKNNNIIKATRNIKCLGDCVGTGEYFLHPITLGLSKNNNTTKKYCPSEFHYDKDGPTYAKQCSSDISSFDIQRFMTLPYLNLNLDQLLDIYKIYNIETLIKWIDNKIEEKLPLSYINRIINIWIKSNYNILIKNNNLISDIYIKINKKYWKFDNESINKSIILYIKKWFKHTKHNEFDFDLGKDLLDYITKMNSSDKIDSSSLVVL